MNYIDQIFQENRGTNISLINKPITEPIFQYLLTKKTKIVTRLNLRKCWHILDGNQLCPLSMRRMREGNWNSLIELRLCIFDFIKFRIWLEIRDVDTFRWAASLI